MSGRGKPVRVDPEMTGRKFREEADRTFDVLDGYERRKVPIPAHVQAVLDAASAFLDHHSDETELDLIDAVEKYQRVEDR